MVHQTFWQLLTHFVYDIFHFDGKFFDTLKYLLIKPGFVPKEYVRGRRFSYLDPIRMYLFTSALFFLVFFSFNTAYKASGILEDSDKPLSTEARREAAAEIREELIQKPADTALQTQLKRLIDTTKSIRASELYNGETGTLVGDSNSRVKTVAQYDSVQKALPARQRDSWMRQAVKRKLFAISAKYSNNPKQGFKDFLEMFEHKLPYLLFASLPFFALLLKLLYVCRKSYYYSDHAVFTLYHYIFSFILLLLVFLFTGIGNWTHFKVFQNAIPYFFLAWAVYLYIAMKRFYGQSHIKTFSKFLLLNLLGIIVLLLLFVVFLFFTLFQL
jgi:hypothetical protein